MLRNHTFDLANILFFVRVALCFPSVQRYHVSASALSSAGNIRRSARQDMITRRTAEGKIKERTAHRGSTSEATLISIVPKKESLVIHCIRHYQLVIYHTWVHAHLHPHLLCFFFSFSAYHHRATNNTHKKIKICMKKNTVTRDHFAHLHFLTPSLQLLICKKNKQIIKKNTEEVIQYFFFQNPLFRVVLKENCCQDVSTEIRRGPQGSWSLQGHCRGSLNVT